MSRLLKVYERTQYGNGAHLIRVDNEDYSKVIIYPWDWHVTIKKGKPVVQIRAVVDSGSQKHTLLARYILGIPNGDMRRVYHREGNLTDFRKRHLKVLVPKCLRSSTG